MEPATPALSALPREEVLMETVLQDSVSAVSGQNKRIYFSFYFIRIIRITFWEIVTNSVQSSNIIIGRCDLHHLMWHQHLHQHHLHQEPQLPQLLHPHQHWNMSVHHQQSLRWCLPAQTGLPDILWLHRHLQRWRLHWQTCCGWKIWEEPPQHLWNQHRLSQ